MTSDPAGSTSATKFDDYAQSYTDLHQQSVGASGESVEYFADYKVACLRRLGAPTDQPLLDFGCGIGNVTSRLVTSFADVHGYELSKSSLEVVQRRLPQVTCHAEIDSIPDGHFATVLMSGVLHHVPPAERPAVLAKARSKLRPGGRLFVFEHNPLNPLTRRAVAMCEFDDDAILVWPWAARRLLRRSGYEGMGLHFIVFFPRSLSWCRGLEPYLSWLPLGAQFLLVGGRDRG